MDDRLKQALLPGVSAAAVREAFDSGAGGEIRSGKFFSPESSAALAANAFGFFHGRTRLLPSLPGCEDAAWPAEEVRLEAVLRFPWRGGRHPHLDAVVQTPDCLIGIESKRYEPYRGKARPSLSEAYDRDVWGSRMDRYRALKDRLRADGDDYRRLDAAQLVKHALGLRTSAGRFRPPKRSILVYLHAEPRAWADGREIPAADHDLHRAEVARFAAAVAGEEVAFRSLAYRDLVTAWADAPESDVRRHARALSERFLT